MPSINVLPKQVSELIAAGEVVERPSSVIKELVENSVDAGSTKITVEIKNGGVTFMRVTDNGCGIERDDVTTAFKRHATSKVKTEDDLNTISTLGFRGEALAAISSVSKIEMLTKTKGSVIGTSYFANGAEGIVVNDAGCPDGTTIIVRDLFYNTPARMKFLKKDVAEGNSVAAILDHIALSHPEISMRFIRDGKNVFTSPGDGNLLSAIYEVCGREFAASLLPVEGELDGVKVNGYTCRPTACKPKKTSQFVFLNGRYVRSGTVSSALEAAYKNMAMIGRYPAAVLHITVPYNAVDINVHPAKTEVRFTDERRVFSSVMFSIRNALSKGDERPELYLQQRPGQIRMTSEQYRQSVLPGIEKSTDPLKSYENMISSVQKTNYSIGFNQGSTDFNQHQASFKAEISKTENPYWGNNSNTEVSYEKPSETDIIVQSKAGENQPFNEPDKDCSEYSNNKSQCNTVDFYNTEEDALKPEIEYIGEAFATYIIVRKEESLYIIDKHAAHERILFNKLKATHQVNVQMLLTPCQAVLRKSEYTAIVENLELLSKAGFEVEDFGDSTVLVRAIPAPLYDEDITDLLTEIAGNLMEKQTVEVERLERLYETISCRSAVKGGNLSSPEELKALAEAVLASNEIMYCPHGRPVAMEIKRREIEKQFGRIQ